MTLNHFGMVSVVFSFNCRYSAIFTSSHVNTNGKIFVDGPFGRETHYHIYLQL